jgi:hypothetical protein
MLVQMHMMERQHGLVLEGKSCVSQTLLYMPYLHLTTS